MAIDYSFDKPKAFKFSANAKDLEQVLSRVSGVMGASASQTKHYFLIARHRKLCVLAFNQDTFCAVVAPNAVSESDGAVGIQPATLQGVIKARAEMDFEFSGQELIFKAAKGKYNGKVVVEAVTSEQIAYIAATFGASAKKTDATSGLSRATLDTLKEGMRLTAVADVYTGKDLASFVVFEPKSIMVSSFDHHHFALYRKKLKDSTLDFRVALPINHFNIIDKMMESAGKDAKFILRPEAIRVEGPNFLLSLPATQAEDVNFDRTAKFLKTHGELPYRFSYSHDTMSKLVDNLFTLNADNSRFEIAYKKDSIGFTFATQAGAASDAFKVKTLTAKNPEAKVNIEPRLLRDLIRLGKGQKETVLAFKENVICMIESKIESGASLTLACAVVVDEKKTKKKK